MVGTELYQVGFGTDSDNAATMSSGLNPPSHVNEAQTTSEQATVALRPPMWNNGMIP